MFKRGKPELLVKVTGCHKKKSSVIKSCIPDPLSCLAIREHQSLIATGNVSQESWPSSYLGAADYSISSPLLAQQLGLEQSLLRSLPSQQPASQPILQRSTNLSQLLGSSTATMADLQAYSSMRRSGTHHHAELMSPAGGQSAPDGILRLQQLFQQEQHRSPLTTHGLSAQQSGFASTSLNYHDPTGIAGRIVQQTQQVPVLAVQNFLVLPPQNASSTTTRPIFDSSILSNSSTTTTTIGRLSSAEEMNSRAASLYLQEQRRNVLTTDLINLHLLQEEQQRQQQQSHEQQQRSAQQRFFRGGGIL
jgi:hypothetical protein